MSSTTLGEQEWPVCGRCPRFLHSILDMQKTTGRYWINCYVCREKHTDERRQQRGAPLRERGIRSKGGLRNQPRKVYMTQRTRRPNCVTQKVPKGYGSGLITISNDGEGEKHRAMSDDEEDYFSASDEVQNEIAPSSDTHDEVSPAPPQDPECSVCGDTFAADQFSFLKDCSHEAQVCAGCFADWLASQIGNTSWDRIKCPADGCEVLVAHEDMKRLATQDIYTR